MICPTSAQSDRPLVRNKEIELEFGAELQQIAPGGRTTGVIPVPIDAPEPFLALGVKWFSESAAMISFRSSTDGLNWTVWAKLNLDNHAEDSPGEFTGSLVFLDRESRYVQFKIDSETGQPGLKKMKLNFISPGATTRQIQDQLQNKMFEELAADQMQSNKYPKPNVVTRTEWGCPDGQVTTHGTLGYTTVTHLIVHHTADVNTHKDWAAVVRSIWNFHVFSNGWSDVGYNYLIDPNGVIYEGRSGGDNVVGAHFSGVNGGTMGVSMLGTFTDVKPTPKALTSLRKLLAWKADQRNIDPTIRTLHSASNTVINTVSGHRDGPAPTECPGNMLYTLLPSLRTEVKNLIASISPVVGVSAASYKADQLAPGSIVAAYGTEMASSAETAPGLPLPKSLGDTSVIIRDSAGKEITAPLFFVSSGQINFLIPEDVSTGQASIQVVAPDGRISSGTTMISQTAPGLFSADASGKGIAAALVLRNRPDGSQNYEQVARFDDAQKKFIPLPIDLGPESDQVFLVAFGTGFRFRSSLGNISAMVGGTALVAEYAGPVADYVGLDQLNLRLSRTLIGRGDVILEVSVDGKAANMVTLAFK